MSRRDGAAASEAAAEDETRLQRAVRVGHALKTSESAAGAYCFTSDSKGFRHSMAADVGAGEAREEFNRRMAKLREKYQNLRTAQKSAKRLEEAKELIARLQAALLEMINALEAQRDAAAAAERDAAAAAAATAEEEQRNAALLARDIAITREQLAEALVTVLEAQALLNERNFQLILLTGEVKALEAENAVLMESDRVAKAEIEGLLGWIQKLNDENLKRREVALQLAKELGDATGRLKQTEAELTDANSKLAREIEETEAARKDLDAKVKRLEEAVKDLEEAAAAQKRDCDEERSKIEECKDALVNARQALTIMQLQNRIPKKKLEDYEDLPPLEPVTPPAGGGGGDDTPPESPPPAPPPPPPPPSRFSNMGAIELSDELWIAMAKMQLGDIQLLLDTGANPMTSMNPNRLPAIWTMIAYRRGERPYDARGRHPLENFEKISGNNAKEWGRWVMMWKEPQDPTSVKKVLQMVTGAGFKFKHLQGFERCFENAEGAFKATGLVYVDHATMTEMYKLGFIDDEPFLCRLRPSPFLVSFGNHYRYELEGTPPDNSLTQIVRLVDVSGKSMKYKYEIVKEGETTEGLTVLDCLCMSYAHMRARETLISRGQYKRMVPNYLLETINRRIVTLMQAGARDGNVVKRLQFCADNECMFDTDIGNVFPTQHLSPVLLLRPYTDLREFREAVLPAIGETIGLYNWHAQ